MSPLTLIACVRFTLPTGARTSSLDLWQHRAAIALPRARSAGPDADAERAVRGSQILVGAGRGRASRSSCVSLRSPCRAARSGLKIGAGRPQTPLLLDPYEVVR